MPFSFGGDSLQAMYTAELSCIGNGSQFHVLGLPMSLSVVLCAHTALWMVFMNVSACSGSAETGLWMVLQHAPTHS